jgi:tripartite-type tricarboxylate transporter receptor subunit TctC
MKLTRRAVLAGATLPIATPMILRHGAAWGQSYPSQDIHVICGYAPGTGADIVVRFFAEQIRKRANKTVVVENKPGAGTSIASEYVARSKPDGHIMLINPGNGLAGNVYLYKKLSHDVLKDFSPITTLVKLPFVLAVSPTSPATNVAEFLDLIRKKGEKASYGYPNNLSLAAGELLNVRMGLKAVSVPYKSTPEALNDMTNGLIDYLWSDATFGIGQARAGKMRNLAVTSNTRSGLDPSLPTLQESGVKDYHVAAWWGAWFPANTPRPIVDTAAKWLNDALADPAVQEHFAKVAPADPFPGSPESLREYLRQDIPRWAELFRLAKVEPQ